MSTASTSLPAKTDMLCEGCGYVLNGLSVATNCPECGKPVAESDPMLRTPPAWEQATATPRLIAFCSTTASVIVSPGSFYRSLSTRGDERRSAKFAHLHMALAGAIFGVCLLLHTRWLYALSPSSAGLLSFLPGSATLAGLLPFALVGMVGGYLVMLCVASLAGWLTSIEARYWGMRLPLATVRRVLDYHAAHYLPVAVAILATIGGYMLLRAGEIIGARFDMPYLYTLCGMIVVCALYLFRTYWIGMSNLKFANY